jgi:predicted metal-dependent HD superfamily phosphohydrolase
MTKLLTGESVLNLWPINWMVDDRLKFSAVLEAYYEQPWRFYHNLAHIHGMIWDAYRMTEESVPLNNDFFWAIIYHDIYYEPVQGVQNELRSAQFARKFGPIYGYKGVDWDRVATYIMATRHLGDLENAPQEERLIADLDLKGLSLFWDEYLKNRDNIAREYLTVYTANQFMFGRVQFLSGMLRRKQIYYFERFDEEAARENLTKELDWLEGSEPQDYFDELRSSLIL